MPPKDLRCFCHLRPRLATFGVDSDSQPYIHVKVYKGGNIFGEIVITGDGAKVRLRCRECFRWHIVIIRHGNNAELQLDRSIEEGFPQS